jgi:hypothetical protein
MDDILSSNNDKLRHIIIMFTICLNILIIKDEITIKFNKITEIIFLFMSVIFYTINKQITFCMILTYLMVKYKNSSIRSNPPYNYPLHGR